MNQKRILCGTVTYSIVSWGTGNIDNDKRLTYIVYKVGPYREYITYRADYYTFSIVNVQFPLLPLRHAYNRPETYVLYNNAA